MVEKEVVDESIDQHEKEGLKLVVLIKALGIIKLHKSQDCVVV